MGTNVIVFPPILSAMPCGCTIDYVSAPLQTAERLFRRLLKGPDQKLRWLITDKLRSYDAAHRTLMPTVPHLNHVDANKRAEVSHQRTRQRGRAMRGFSSSTQLQQLLPRHGLM